MAYTKQVKSAFPLNNGFTNAFQSGDGVNLYSSSSASDASYSSKTGTSMAAPNVAGTLLLLQQYYNELNGNFMKASTLKGLACHTADDASPTGPDAVYGWGLLNAKAAAETILENHHLYCYPRISEGKIKSNFNNHPKIHKIEAPIIELSASLIRNGIKNKKNVVPMLPIETWKYIDEMNFYRK